MEFTSNKNNISLSNGKIKINDFQTDCMLTENEMIFIYKLAKKKKCKFIEIGTHLGGSSILFNLAMSNDSILFTIDPFTFTRKPALELKYQELFSKVKNLKNKVIFLSQSSDKIVRTWKKKMDGIFIDGDHSYAACYSDIINWFPHLKIGGKLLIHDYFASTKNTWGNFCGVTKAVEELVLDNDCFENIEIVDSLLICTKKNNNLKNKKILRKKNIKNFGDDKLKHLKIFPESKIKTDEFKNQTVHIIGEGSIGGLCYSILYNNFQTKKISMSNSNNCKLKQNTKYFIAGTPYISIYNKLKELKVNDENIYLVYCHPDDFLIIK